MSSIYHLLSQVLQKSFKQMSELGESIVELFQIHGINAKSKILDVGCKEGSLSHYLMSQGYSVAGLDIMEEEEETVGILSTSVELRRSSIEEIGEAYPEASFDAAIISRVGTLGKGKEKDGKILRGIRTLVKPGGILAVLRQPNRDYLLQSCPKRSLISLGEIEVKMEEFIDPYSSWLHARCSYFKKLGDGRLLSIGDSHLKMRVYSLHEIIELGKESGWELVSAYSDISTLKPFSDPFSPTLNVIFKRMSRKDETPRKRSNLILFPLTGGGSATCDLSPTNRPLFPRSILQL